MPTEPASSRRRARPRIENRPGPRPQLVAPANFLLAKRDTGYKSTPLAVAEFIDNSLQAGARSVSVEVLQSENRDYPLELRVIDDGEGMTREALASALTFGGSTRFDDRTSL